MSNKSKEQIAVDLLVLGGGPGGYSAAFRASDLGLRTAIVERYEKLGGVCLNVGCVPSKALLHVTTALTDVSTMSAAGIVEGTLRVNLDSLRQWKNGIVEKLNSGLDGLAKRRKITVLNGKGKFVSLTEAVVDGVEKSTTVKFKKAIIATGSTAMTLPFLPDDERILDSTAALEIANIPKQLLVIGGGIVGLEMATVYQALGSSVTVIELSESIIPGVEKTVARTLFNEMKKKITIYTNTKVTNVTALNDKLTVALTGKKSPEHIDVDNILVAIGRTPNSRGIGVEELGVNVDERGFISVDEQQRTNISEFFAIGDVAPGPMLAHKAAAEGRLAAEVCAGLEKKYSFKCIPSVAYTSPEVAIVGMSEGSAKNAGYDAATGKFPFAANARAMTLGDPVGFSKIIYDKKSEVVLGAEIVGPMAGELISEMAMAIQNELTIAQVTQTIHPHPSLTECVLAATEVCEGTVTDLFIPRRK